MSAEPQPNSPWTVQLFELNYDEREAQAVANVLARGWITMGEETDAFEREFSAFQGHESLCVAVSSCTAALHLALLALEIGPGDEVIIPALTFVGDANVVRRVGAVPVVADSKSLTDWNIDPAEIEKRITTRTKAIIIIHFAGVPCDMDEIMALAQRHGLPVIEDCAHAPGATYRNRHAGTFGEIACFSFYTNKNLSVGEGGMLATRSAAMAERLRYLRSHGMTKPTLERFSGRAHSYDVALPGLNYRIDEMRAALGRVQLTKLAGANARRRELTERYIENLSGQNQIIVPFQGVGEKLSAYHIMPVMALSAASRDRIIEVCKQRRVQTSIHYPSLRAFTAYADMDLAATPIADEICQREVTLPLHPNMSFGNVDTVTEALMDAVSEAA